jgi:type VI secretion system secreted protein Hcp
MTRRATFEHQRDISRHHTRKRIPVRQNTYDFCAASSSGGASSERASFSDVAITKNFDKASPKLAVACADGTHIKEIIIEFCRAGGDKMKYMEFKLTNCIISSISVHGGQGGEPLENLRFNYGKIEWTYTRQKRSDGSGGGNVAAGWDLQSNKKV